MNHDPKDLELIRAMAADPEIKRLRRELFDRVSRYRYSYNFQWLGRPIIQFPEDIVAIQEILWAVRPDFVLETGIAHGGSLMLSASILELLGGDRQVVGVDIDIRAHNRAAIEAHPLKRRITLIQGSSIASEVVEQVFALAKGRQRVLVILDSNHTHDHVLEELKLYSPLVHEGSYLITMDTVVEHMPSDFFPDRPWSRGNNPMTAVHEFLKTNDRFEIDTEMDGKLAMSVAPNGYLRCRKG